MVWRKSALAVSKWWGGNLPWRFENAVAEIRHGGLKMLWRKSATWRIFINSVAGRGMAEKNLSALWRGMAVPPCHAMPRLVAEFSMAIYIPGSAKIKAFVTFDVTN